MAYRVEVSPAAARQLRKIDRRSLSDIAEKIDSLALEPRPRDCQKLRGHQGLYRVRVGEYRIIYGVEDRLVVVVVLKIGDRAEVYRRIRGSDVDFLRRLLSEL